MKKISVFLSYHNLHRKQFPVCGRFYTYLYNNF